MSDTADANLVLAALDTADALHERAQRHLRDRRLIVPLAVGVELLLVARKRRVPAVEVIGAADERFDLPDRDVLLTAARALDEGEVSTPLDAVHLADAFHRGGTLHTADAELLRSRFPTTPF